MTARDGEWRVTARDGEWRVTARNGGVESDSEGWGSGE